MSDIALGNAASERLEAIVGAMEQVDLNTSHALSGGLYARTIYIPAGVTLVGCTHKKDHVNVIIGDISVSTDEGLARFTGHHVIECKAGHKRHGYAHSDTAWTTIVRTDLTDLAEIENECVLEPERLQTRTLALAAKQEKQLCHGQQ
jgi:hypothetical protein